MTKILKLIPSLTSPLALKENALRRSLQIDRRARADAKTNLPGPNETDLNGPQLAVQTACEHAHDELKQWRDRRLAEKAAAIAKHDLSDEERDFETPVEDAKLALQAQRHQSHEVIVAARVVERRQQRERESFRRDNELYREACPQVPVLTVAIILTALIAETALNANLFAEVSDFGYVGGIVMAFLMSLPNLLLGLLAGFFGLRGTLHVNWALKIGGVSLTLLCTSAITGYNLYLAHYRKLIADNPDAQFLDAWPLILSDPFAFLAVKDALILCLIGLATAFIVTWKGFDGFSDRYPGYSRVDKRTREAEDALEATKRDHNAKVQKIADQGIAIIDARIKVVTKKLKTAIVLLNEALIDVKTANDAAYENARVCRRLLKAYREENSRIRTLPAPDYFNHYPIFETEIGPLTSFDPQQMRESLNQRADLLRSRARDAKAALRDLAAEALAQIPELIRDAEQEAERRLENDSNSKGLAALSVSPSQRQLNERARLGPSHSLPAPLNPLP